MSDNKSLDEMDTRELIDAVRNKVKSLTDYATILLVGVFIRRLEEQANKLDRLTLELQCADPDGEYSDLSDEQLEKMSG